MTTLSNRANPDEAGYLGEGGTGVYGRNIFPNGNGIIGASDDGRGVWGHSKTGFGVLGQSVNGIGVSGESTSNEGVRGVSHGAHGGVVGVNDWAPADPPGAGGNGGWFESTQGEGVRGMANNPHHGGIVGVNTAGGIAIYGTSTPRPN
jgi:hypothetical protein